ACSQIAACWIENRIVVGKWHVFEPRRRHFFVKRGPAAVVTLEAELPTKRTAIAFVERLSIFRVDQSQRHYHHRRVVSVGIVNIVVLECPSARFWMRIICCPITTYPHLLVNKPICGFLQRGMFRGHARFRQRNDVDRGVPDGRKTRLYAKILGIIDKQRREVSFCLGVNRVSFRITEGAQGDQTVEHRRKDRRQAITAFANAFEHPSLRFFKRAPTHWAKSKWTQKF